jgi:hypothetical protein
MFVRMLQKSTRPLSKPFFTFGVREGLLGEREGLTEDGGRSKTRQVAIKIQPLTKGYCNKVQFAHLPHGNNEQLKHHLH